MPLLGVVVPSSIRPLLVGFESDSTALERLCDRFDAVAVPDVNASLERLDRVDCVVCNRCDAVERIAAVDRDVPIVLFPRDDGVDVLVERLDAIVDSCNREDGDRTARKEELERYETIIDALGDPVYVLDSAGRYTYVNDAFVEETGYEREEILGRHVSVVLPKESLERGEAVVRSLLDDDRNRATLEMERVTADGETVHVENHIALLPPDEEGRFQGTAGIIRNIEEREARKRELKRQNDRLDRFAGVVSHDLRNPLSIATGRLELARAECDSEHLDAIADAHDRIDSIIQGLLELARSGGTIDAAEPIALERAAERAWEMTGTGSCTLEIATDATIRGDEQLVIQLLENLFRNAVEHGGDAVTVEIGSLPDGFYVADDGVGFEPAERRQLQEDETNSTGLGFTIVHDIGDAHGWTIDLRDSESGGARIEITDVERE